MLSSLQQSAWRKVGPRPGFQGLSRRGRASFPSAWFFDIVRRHTSSKRKAAVPRPDTAPAARAQTWGQTGPNRAKSGQKWPSGHAASSAAGLVRSGPWGLGVDGRLGRNLKLPKTLPSTGAYRPPPASPEGWVVGLTEGAISGKLKLWSRLVTSGHLKSLLAAGSGVGKSTPPAIPRGVLVRPVRCGPESGQPEGLKPE